VGVAQPQRVTPESRVHSASTVAGSRTLGALGSSCVHHASCACPNAVIVAPCTLESGRSWVRSPLPGPFIECRSDWHRHGGRTTGTPRASAPAPAAAPGTDSRPPAARPAAAAAGRCTAPPSHHRGRRHRHAPKPAHARDPTALCARSPAAPARSAGFWCRELAAAPRGPPLGRGTRAPQPPPRGHRNDRALPADQREL
jgi:hypothetical protein